MTDAMQVLKKDFMPTDLAPLLKQIGFDGCIAVQARQSVEETNWLLKLAHENDFIKGVVGWVDLRSANIYNVLSGYAKQRKLVGVRHVVHDEPEARRQCTWSAAHSGTWELPDGMDVAPQDAAIHGASRARSPAWMRGSG